MDLSLIPPSPEKGMVNLVVEIPAGSRNKYEYCSQAGIMALQHGITTDMKDTWCTQRFRTDQVEAVWRPSTVWKHT